MYSRNMPGDRAELIDPFALSAADGYAWLKGNLHSHTTCSDGRLSPQQRADAYAAAGYDFLAITDHYRITSLSGITPARGLVLIQGVELHPDNPFGGQVHHFVGLHVRPVIHDIQLRRERSANGRRIAATVVCSEAKRIDAISDLGGASYREQDATFEQATFPLKVDARWVRFEVIAPDGSKAWSNPFDLTAR